MGGAVLLHASGTPNFPEHCCFHGLSCCKGPGYYASDYVGSTICIFWATGVCDVSIIGGIPEPGGRTRLPAEASWCQVLFFTISGYELGCRLYFCTV